MGEQSAALTREEAVRLGETRWWESPAVSDHDIVEFQLFTDKLCMEFSEFHRALEAVLGRPVFTHELGLNMDGLREEFLGERPAPSFSEIMDLIPEEKRIFVFLDDEAHNHKGESD